MLSSPPLYPILPKGRKVDCPAWTIETATNVHKHMERLTGSYHQELQAHAISMFFMSAKCSIGSMKGAICLASHILQRINEHAVGPKNESCTSWLESTTFRSFWIPPGFFSWPELVRWSCTISDDMTYFDVKPCSHERLNFETHGDQGIPGYDMYRSSKPSRKMFKLYKCK